MWLSQYDLTGIYLDGDTQREEADFTARMAQVLDNVKAQGFNTVLFAGASQRRQYVSL